ncbi:Hypothetical protein NTJ_09343 [Nesidiocoris tenuis]|uniref:Uncharacterized protein n=1 Tax=Nesidiocoris tenuis TaxID=355587 RepID=A0ABN7AWH0_9HEMI|nr:Hypothetical protein NTJ_09343 [Nesidiocoris tenuis]
MEDTAAKNRTKIKFDGDADVVLLKEVAGENPFEDGGKWKLIAEKMKRIIPKDVVEELVIHEDAMHEDLCTESEISCSPCLPARAAENTTASADNTTTSDSAIPPAPSNFTNVTLL